MEVVISLGIVSLVVLLLVPMFQHQLTYFRKIEEQKEIRRIERQMWERVIGGTRNEVKKIQGTYDSYTVTIQSKPEMDDVEYVQIQIQGGEHGKEGYVEGYVEKTGLFTY